MGKVNRKRDILIIFLDIVLVGISTVYFMLFITGEIYPSKITIGFTLFVTIIFFLMKALGGLSKLR